MNRTTQIIVSLVIAGLVLGGMWWFGNQENDNSTSLEALSFEGASDVEQYEVEIDQDTSPEFVHANPSFSFKYPEGFTTSSFEERGGELILIQRAEESTGLQVFLTPFDEPASVLTPQRIQQDVSNLKMQAVQPVIFGGEQAGVTFVNVTNSDNPTREVWFVRDGFLYQVTTTANFESALERIMSTWVFGA